ncbi:MAG: DEAD/DEAH box helicase [Anaerolineae bacterium]
MSNPLDAFSPAVRRWFEQTLGQPTPPQAQGWPPIQRGEHTLILAPTGSGKTIAAFLWGIDRIYQEKGRQEDKETAPGPAFGVRKQVDKGTRHPSVSGGPPPQGVRLLYISPLKALNNDIERNLQVPLEGIRAVAEQMGAPLPRVRVMVRTGDTPSSTRQQMVKQPPDILITTPESLYLMLTSPRAREMFRTVSSVIVDEIHTLVGSKRGVHLALSLERLEHLAAQPVQRIGLSATIKPLEEAARFLGGQMPSTTRNPNESPGDAPRPEGVPLGQSAILSRPVTIVDAHYHKALDLKVVTVVDDFREMPGDTIWPSLIPQVLDDVRRHRTTLIFANNRRLAERTADRLNAQLAAEQSEEMPPGGLALLPDGVAHDRGIFATGAEGPFRAHHGSMSKESRREMETDLKAGKLPALVGTSSLELGIDIGAVDLVVQLQSPKSVSQGLQRVGRSGHLVGQTSRGRVYPTFREDLAEAAAIVRGMLDGDVEPTYTPQNPLDVLAQQVVAMVAVEDWAVPTLYDLVRCAYPYRDLSLSAFHSVLDMLSGRYYTELAGASMRPSPSLRAKIAWDRVHDRLTALPGSRLLALSNAGVIPDTGAYHVYLTDGKTKVGELDEEFVFETREGDAFLLGSNVWRVREIADDRIIVSDAGGATPRMPFWRGDIPYHPYELGARIGRFRREISERIQKDPERLDAVEAWLEQDYVLDQNSARNLIAYVKRQLDAVGVMSSDTTIVVESFTNALGDPHLVIHSPFGGRVNGAWALALSSALRERMGVSVEMQTNDDGIILHLTQLDRDPPMDLVQQMSPSEARERLLWELPNSAVFGAQFRMNASRALLLPRARGKKRTPFWLQRLKARDLLAIARRFDDFPIVAETYRDCLRDVFDLPHLEEVLGRIASGEIRVVPIETVVPSPVAAGLLVAFNQVYLYEWDAPKAERNLQFLSLRREVLNDLLKGIELSDLLKPEAIAETFARAQHLASGYQARSAEELAVYLAELGDLTTDELIARALGDGQAWIEQLAAQSRIVPVPIPTSHGVESRWVLAEQARSYRQLKALPPLSGGASDPGGWEGSAGGEALLRRLLRISGPVTRAQILDRYAFPQPWLDATLEQFVNAQELVRGHFTARDRDEFCDQHLLEEIHRRTLTLLRHEVQPVSVYAYADFLARWQHLAPATRFAGPTGLHQALEQLRGVAAPAPVWERDLLPARLADYDPVELDALCQTGELVWVGSGRDPRRGHIRFLFRGEGGLFLPSADPSGLSAEAQAVYEYLKSEGASFASDLQAGLHHRPDVVAGALVELAMAGLATNDSAETLRQMIVQGTSGPGREEDGARRPLSELEQDLAARRQGRPALSRSRLNDARRRVTQRLRSESQGAAWSGRWALVHRVGILGPALSDEGRGAKLARTFLARYGVVTREAIAHEEGLGDWALLYPQFQRMEMRGEVRRGYFVAGLSGLQFALPEAVDLLRVQDRGAEDATLILNATDPANLFGGELADGPMGANGAPLRFARVPSTHLALWRGQPILVAEDSGERMTTLANIPSEVIARALSAYFHRPGVPRRSVVTRWNGASVIGSPGQALLEVLGFSRAPAGLERWSER